MEDVLEDTPDPPKQQLLARELEYWLKCSNLPPQSYLRDLLQRSAETIHTIHPTEAI